MTHPCRVSGHRAEEAVRWVWGGHGTAAHRVLPHPVGGDEEPHFAEKRGIQRKWGLTADQWGRPRVAASSAHRAPSRENL